MDHDIYICLGSFQSHRDDLFHHSFRFIDLVIDPGLRPVQIANGPNILLCQQLDLFSLHITNDDKEEITGIGKAVAVYCFYSFITDILKELLIQHPGAGVIISYNQT